MKKAAVPSILFALVLLVLGVIAEAQHPGKVPRIGYLSPTGDSHTPGPDVEAFRQGLRDLGYVEGKNILIEYHYIAGKTDRIPSLVAELVQSIFLSFSVSHRFAQASRRLRQSLLS
jgi:hypothetical protein